VEWNAQMPSLRPDKQLRLGPIAAGDRPQGLLASGRGADRAARLAAADPPGRLAALARAADSGRLGGKPPRACMPGSRSPLSPPAWARRCPRCPGRWPPTAAGSTGRGGLIRAPRAGSAAPRLPASVPAAGGQVTARLAEWRSRVQMAAPVADRVPARPHDEGERRDHLPGAVRAGPR
jgi:hypothetical protein